MNDAANAQQGDTTEDLAPTATVEGPDGSTATASLEQVGGDDDADSSEDDGDAESEENGDED